MPLSPHGDGRRHRDPEPDRLGFHSRRSRSARRPSSASPRSSRSCRGSVAQVSPWSPGWLVGSTTRTRHASTSSSRRRSSSRPPSTSCRISSAQRRRRPPPGPRRGHRGSRRRVPLGPVPVSLVHDPDTDAVRDLLPRRGGVLRSSASTRYRGSIRSRTRRRASTGCHSRDVWSQGWHDPGSRLATARAEAGLSGS
jgi:hypothetical protein